MTETKGKVVTFRDLKVWQKAHSLVLEIYKLTRDFPNEEKYGLTAQIRRSVASIATNIVEGHRRNGKKDFLHFLNLSDGSLEETKYHLMLSKDLGYISEEKFDNISSMADEVGRMLFGFRRSLSS